MWRSFSKNSDAVDLSDLASGLHSPFVARIQFVNLVALAAMAACWLLTSARTLFYRFIWAICLVLLLLISAYVGGRGYGALVR